MRRCWLLLVAVFFLVGAASPVRALTREEILQRRLEKMNQADAKLIEAEKKHRDQAGKFANALPEQGKEHDDTLTIPNPPRAAALRPTAAPTKTDEPSPDPRRSLWDMKPKAASAPAASRTKSATTKASGRASVQTPAPAFAASASRPGTPTSGAPTANAAPQPKRDPKAAAALAVKASQKAKAGDRATALALLNKAVTLDPANPDLFNNRGNVQANSDHTRQAVADYDRAISLNATKSTYFTNRGLAYERLGNQMRACADYQAACDLGDCGFLKSYKAEGHCR